jgi:hypothetical protein
MAFIKLMTQKATDIRLQRGQYTVSKPKKIDSGKRRLPP